jgi:hypothetical protein
MGVFKTLTLLFTLTSISVFASVTPASIPSNVRVDQIKSNIDGSVTFTDVRMLRGDYLFNIAASGNYGANVCTLLGYSNSMSDANLSQQNRQDSSDWMIVLDEEGRYSNAVRSRFSVSKVTCFNEGELNPKVDFDRVENTDGSFRITNVKYHRGDMEFYISSATKNFDSACKLLGYEYALLGGPVLNNIQNLETFSFMVNINEEGMFDETIKSKYYFDKLTCWAGTEPEVIVIVDGQRYRTGPGGDLPEEELPVPPTEEEMPVPPTEEEEMPLPPTEGEELF